MADPEAAVAVDAVDALKDEKPLEPPYKQFLEEWRHTNKLLSGILEALHALPACVEKCAAENNAAYCRIAEGVDRALPNTPIIARAPSRKS